MYLQSATQTQRTFSEASVIEVHPQRNQRHAFDRRLADELVELALVNQELSRPFRFMVPDRGLLVFGNLTIDQPKFTVFDTTVSFIQRAFAIAQTLDFAPDERHATFERIENLVLMASLPIVDDQLLVLIDRFFSGRWGFGQRSG